MGLGILFVALATGVFLGMITAATPAKTGENSGFTSCPELCNQWDNRRQESCNAETAAARQQQTIVNLVAASALAALLAAAALVAAFAALSNPITAAFAPALFVTATVLGFAAVAAASAVVTANSILLMLQRAVADAKAREAAARSAMTASCSSSDAAACLSRPSPC